MSHSEEIVAPARFARIETDGEVLLANLDIDGGLPPRGTDLTRLLDGLNDVIDGPGDLSDLIRLAVHPTSPGQSLYLQIAPGDARRVRLFRSDGDGGWVRAVGAAADPAGESVRIPLPLDDSGGAELRMEAVTLRGAPGLNGSPAEVEVRVTNGADAGGDSVRLRIAPFFLLSNLDPVERIYVVYYARQTNEGTHPMVADLAEALRLAYGEDAVPRESADGFTPGENGRLHLIDGGRFRFPDFFPQDEFEIGYCGTGSVGMRVAVHNPRNKGDGLRDWVRTELPRHGVGLFGDLAAPLPIDSTDYGGNLEVSGPVMSVTPEQEAGIAGPRVPEHGVAPHGKILLGECRRHVFTLPSALAPDLDGGGSARVWWAFEDHKFGLRRTMRVTVLRAGRRWLVEDRSTDHRWPASWVFEIVAEPHGLEVHYTRSVSPAYRAFLEAQGGVQPILPLDTSWLHVGHVDELLSVVPGDASAPFRLLLASPERALRLLELALSRETAQGFGLTQMLRGQGLPFELTDPATVLRSAEDLNGELDEKVINAIEQRLMQGLALSDDDLIRLPVLFVTDVKRQPDEFELPDVGRLRATARTPNLVNALVSDRNVFLPHALGPRMRPDGVALVLRDLDPRLPALTGEQLGRLTDQRHWATSRTWAGDLAGAFGVSKEALLATGQFDANEETPARWTRIRIPGGDVDVFEAYTASALARRGLTAYFIDTWAPFHLNEGEVHCGTNVMRTPREATTDRHTGRNDHDR
ncbi:protein-arginine deiminase family protein [Nonomuraea sp. NPDC050404]|uniref:protein-arginine deiminase family protein n=1 Tax=Nonomuraea sp. NPDC050404 TaxID=3155783 RepID=UPI0033D2F7AC